MSLCTLANVKEYLEITLATHDARLTALAARAQAHIEDFCGRKFDAADYVEQYDGDGLSVLSLRQFPVVTFTSLYDDLDRVFAGDTLIAAADYYVDKSAGVVELSSGAVFQKGRGNVRATYRAGYETAAIPASLTQACVMATAALFEERKNIGVAQRSLKDGGVSAYRHGVPEEVWKLVEPHKRRLVA